MKIDLILQYDYIVQKITNSCVLYAKYNIFIMKELLQKEVFANNICDWNRKS